MAASVFYQGDFQSAHDHFEQALSYYDFDDHRSTLSLFVWDPAVVALCYQAQTLYFLGFPDRAEKCAAKALELAKQLSSPFNEALCHGLNSTYYAYRRDAEQSFAQAESALKPSNDHGFVHWAALGNINKGWSLCALGNISQGLPTLLNGLGGWKSMGAEMGVPTFQVLLGEVYQRAGTIPDALAMVEDGLAVSRRNNDRHYDAELYRLKGELLLKSARRKPAPSIEETEACFQSAIHVARKQKARSLELRAATALARLWRDSGKSRDAHHLLHRIYRLFTEGFDTPDLTQARALLDELG